MGISTSGFRLENKIQKDDLILYEMDGQICVSRVVAKGTDYVDMDEDGYLYINGTVQSGEILSDSAKDTFGISLSSTEGVCICFSVTTEHKQLTAEILVLCRKKQSRAKS